MGGEGGGGVSVDHVPRRVLNVNAGRTAWGLAAVSRSRAHHLACWRKVEGVASAHREGRGHS